MTAREIGLDDHQDLLGLVVNCQLSLLFACGVSCFEIPMVNPCGPESHSEVGSAPEHPVLPQTRGVVFSLCWSDLAVELLG